MSCGRSLEGNELQTDPDRRQSSLQKSPSQEGSNPFYPRLETDRSSTPIIGTVVVADFSCQTVSLIMASIKPWFGISNGKERRISIPIHMFRVLGLIYTRSVIDMEDFKQRDFLIQKRKISVRQLSFDFVDLTTRGLILSHKKPSSTSNVTAQKRYRKLRYDQ